MKNENFKPLRLTKLVAGGGSLLLSLTCQLTPGLAAADDSTASAEETRSATVITPSSRKTTAADSHQHAGAKILSDDTDVADDEQTKVKSAPGKAEIPIVEYKETAATELACKQAITYNNQKQYSQATTLLTSAITKDPRTILARRLYAMTEIMDQDPDKAIAVLEMLGKYTRPTSNDKILLASAFWAKGNALEAAANFKDAVGLAPDNFYAEQGYIKSLILASQYDQALPECLSALKRFTNPKAQVELKKLYAQIQAERAAAQRLVPPPGDAHLGAPVPLQELTPYIIDKQYGG